jgi:TRAP-type C4-dicarboxylate transport system substrate-binding protein
VVLLLAASYEEARRLWARVEAADREGARLAGADSAFAMPWPPQNIYSKREINQASDMKGLSCNGSTQRIAEIVGAYPVTIQAADLPHAFSTGLINFMTSSATGYDSKAWEHMSYFNDVRPWIPKNVTLVNRAAFDGLEPPVQQALLRASATAEARGWKTSEEKTKWYTEQLAARGKKLLPPSQTLKGDLHQIGQRLTGE